MINDTASKQCNAEEKQKMISGHPL